LLQATKVAVLGAAGGIGQPLSLLLKQIPAVSSLNLYDLVGTPGVAADLSHINSKAKVTGFKGADQLGEALKGSQVVVIPAGVPRKPGMTRDDLFNTNASIVATLAHACAKCVLRLPLARDGPRRRLSCCCCGMQRLSRCGRSLRDR
jgi:malate dehydrogenase